MPVPRASNWRNEAARLSGGAEPRPRHHSRLHRGGCCHHARGARARFHFDGVAIRGPGPGRLDSAGLPPSALRAAQLAAEYLPRNQAVGIEPYGELLTTQGVAELLKVSRPTVIEMLDRGELSYEKRT